MKGYLALPPAERRELCEDAQVQLGLAAQSIEKDFWVSWTLRELFALPVWGAQLTFKGGTSLSKGWKLIERFSEDIDVVIDRAFLGFGEGEFGSKRVKRLRVVCSERIYDELQPALHARIEASLGSGPEWSLKLAPKDDDPDQQTLLFAYPTSFVETSRYVKPVVRIELGARSDIEPTEAPAIEPLVAAAYPDVFEGSAFTVRTVAARRTFWEKVLLLHEEGFRPTDKPRKAGLSRHYYDLWSLIKHGIGDEAAQDKELFQAVVSHRKVFFRLPWVDYETCKIEQLRIVPAHGREAAWRQDYAAMREEMFFGDPPTFDEVTAAVRDFEAAVKAGAE